MCLANNSVAMEEKEKGYAGGGVLSVDTSCCYNVHFFCHFGPSIGLGVGNCQGQRGYNSLEIPLLLPWDMKGELGGGKGRS